MYRMLPDSPAGAVRPVSNLTYDWETHKPADLGVGVVPETMTTRHNANAFAPTLVNVRRDRFTEQVILVTISGWRVVNGHPDRTIGDSWEWDRTRDPMSPLMEAVIAAVDGQR